jgi:hypothetical protein
MAIGKRTKKSEEIKKQETIAAQITEKDISKLVENISKHDINDTVLKKQTKSKDDERISNIKDATYTKTEIKK